jgi:hypothetical protein
MEKSRVTPICALHSPRETNPTLVIQRDTLFVAKTETQAWRFQLATDPPLN